MSISRAVIVNPWVHDFYQVDRGVVSIGSRVIKELLSNIMDVSYIDLALCENPIDYKVYNIGATSYSYGEGSFYKSRSVSSWRVSQKFLGFTELPFRNYTASLMSYGLPEDHFRKFLLNLGKVDVALVSSGLTYWYGGVIQTIKIIKECLPGVPIILGGTYASLLPDHAKSSSGADYIYIGAGESGLVKLLGKILNKEFSESTGLYNNFYIGDLLGKHWIPLLTSRGCPFRCSYCASSSLLGDFIQFDTSSVIDFLWSAHSFLKVKDIVFYDDALLLNFSNSLLPLLRNNKFITIGARCHTPNALHVNKISSEVANALFEANFTTLRLAFDDANMNFLGESRGKTTRDNLCNALTNLHRAGYSKGDIGVYTMVGFPNQTTESIQSTVDTILELGGFPILLYYSPIPKTSVYSWLINNKKPYFLDFEADPFYQNPLLLPVAHPSVTHSIIHNMQLDAIKVAGPINKRDLINLDI